MSSLSSERFGVTGGSQPRKWTGLSPADRRRWIERDVLLMKYAGVRWVRVTVPFSEPPPPGQDEYLRLLRDNGIEVLGRFPLSALPSDLPGFRRDIGRTVRANTQIRVWEAGNEPNLNSYWKGAKEDYVPTLQATYEAVKEADASCQVACAGLSEWKVEPYLDMLVRQQADRWMDIFAYHPYAANPQKVVDRLFSARSRFQGSPLHDKPIWITEIGFHSQADWKNNAGHVADENVKSDYLQDTFAFLGRFTQGPIFWYTFQESGLGKYLGYGLLNETREKAASNVVLSPAFDRYRLLSGGSSDNSLNLERILRG